MIDSEKIKKFLEGKDPQEHIMCIECGYGDHEVTVFFRDNYNNIIAKKYPFYPFVWAKSNITELLKEACNGETSFEWKMRKHGIYYRKLNIYDENGNAPLRMKNGYNILFYATAQMSYTKFISFFKDIEVDGKNVDIYGPEKNFVCISPVEQAMTHYGLRYFKGIDDYNALLKVCWDIETTGLNPDKCSITSIGISTNLGYEVILNVEGNTEEERKLSERKVIQKFFEKIQLINPDIITGHNSENFDWPFVIRRIEILWPDDPNLFNKIIHHFWKDSVYAKFRDTKYGISNYTLYKKDKKNVLKLGGEVEYFYPTVWYGHTVVDSLHAVRRAQAIDSNLKSGNLKYAAEYAKLKKQNRVYIPGDKISQIFYDTDNFVLDETNGEWHKQTSNEILNEHQKIVKGKNIVERYLLDDLYEGLKVEDYYNQSSFFLSKMLPIPYQKVITMGTSSTWKSLLLAYSYENNLAIPSYSEAKAFTGGLSRLLQVGFVKKIVKLDYNSLYPSITLTFDIFPDTDISGVFKGLLSHVLSERERYKGLKKEFSKKSELETGTALKLKYEQESARYDKLQLPFKIFGNAFFGSYGAPNIFNWGDLSKGEQITCTGRQCLRLMVRWFEDRNFKTILLDTDGVNYSYEDINKNYKYIGKGLNRNTKEGKEYIGVEAYTAEFNDLFMRDKMGLGIDEYVDASISMSRKNYADLLDDGKVKYVGNSIKSRKMPKYIEKFIENNIILLLNDDGQTFLNNYYDYIEKIYNYNIPLRDIASIGSIKITLDEYKNNTKTKTKAGQDKARQAWYELAIKHNIEVSPGDKIYYVNIGHKKSEGDVIKENIYEYDADGNIVMEDRVDKKTGEIVYGKRGQVMKDKKVIGTYPKLNCVVIEPNIIESETDYYGHEDIFSEPIQYNATKYIQQFNNRIKGLLVCFHPDIRGNILISNPEDRNYFTEEESKLTSGFPNNEIDQDTLEALMTMEDKEIKFWTTNNLIPPFIDETGMNWEDIKKDYFDRQEKLRDEIMKDELEIYNKIIDKITEDDIQKYHDCETNEEKMKLWFMIEIFKICSINHNKDFLSKEHDIKLGNISDILEKSFLQYDSDGVEINENETVEPEVTIIKEPDELIPQIESKYYYDIEDTDYIHDEFYAPKYAYYSDFSNII
jgi:DNA polymerase elongation subunit (family B)